jgi:flagellar biosynthesis protein FliR
MTGSLMPAGLAGLEAQLWLLMVLMVRPSAAFLVAPVFSLQSLPLQVRLILALVIGIAASGQTSLILPAQGLDTLAGILLIAGEMLAGVMIGFAVQIGYSGALVAGELISGAMGLGFASMVDPGGSGSAPVVSSFLSIIALLLFLSADGHLLLIRLLVESYAYLPPAGATRVAGASGSTLPDADALMRLALFGGQAFSAGLLIALPVLSAVILLQIIMGVLSRTSPQLNLFAVGFPVAILAGLVLLALAMPLMGDAMILSLNRGMDMATSLAHGQ